VQKLRQELDRLKGEALQKLDQASTSKDVEALRVSLLGKKGSISEILSQLKDLTAEDRKAIGQIANEVKSAIEEKIEARSQALGLEEMNKSLASDPTDASLPGTYIGRGQRHPLRKIFNEAVEILAKAGLKPSYGPEVEYEDFCFDRLNFKPGHAARDMQATFFVKSPTDEKLVLRTHTSPVQVRVLMAAAKDGMKLPLRVQAPGRVYRVDDDATHAPMFHQIEGLAVDETSTMGDLRAVLDFFFREFFGSGAKVRFRPSYFPFTEPSAEVDVSCVFCKQVGCRVCKHSGWIEVAGAGMVHPEVFQACGWNPQKVQGWAFGMGIERLSMLKLGIPDLRLFFENRLSFIRGAK